MQIGERSRRVDQRVLEMIVLERDNHGAGVDAEDLRKAGARDAPRLPRRDRFLLEIGEQVFSPIHFDERDQFAAQARDPLAAPEDFD